MSENSEVSFDGIEPAVLVHGLYHGTQPLGMGFLHHRGGLSVEDVRTDLTGQAELDGDKLYFDYYYGHPLKVTINTTAKTFNPRLYDRDAGPGMAQRVVDHIRSQMAGI